MKQESACENDDMKIALLSTEAYTSLKAKAVRAARPSTCRKPWDSKRKEAYNKLGLEININLVENGACHLHARRVVHIQPMHSIVLYEN